jgi:hypothetical protein
VKGNRLPYKKYENAMLQLIGDIFSQQALMRQSLLNDMVVFNSLKVACVHFFNNPEKQQQTIFLDHLQCEKENGDRCDIGKCLLIINDQIKENLQSYFPIKSFKGKTISSVANTLTYIAFILLTGKVYALQNPIIYIDYAILRSWTDYVSMEFRRCLIKELEDEEHNEFFQNSKMIFDKIKNKETFSLDLANTYD